MTMNIKHIKDIPSEKYHVHSIAKKRKRRLDIIDTETTISISNMKFK